MKTLFLFGSLVLFTAATGATGCFIEEKPANSAPAPAPAAAPSVAPAATPGAPATVGDPAATPPTDPAATPAADPATTMHPPQMKDPPTSRP
jgi:hypothetical protein